MIKKGVVMFAIMMSFAGTSFAQLKLGYINSLELLSLMPEVAVADKAIETFAKSLEAQYTIMLKEYETKGGEYEANYKTWTPSILQLKQKELVDLENRIGEFQTSIQEDIAEKREEKYAPILEKADIAIKEVAAEGKYTYIFDASTGSLLFADESENILSKVKAKLGL
jgi:outer membrane protein